MAIFAEVRFKRLVANASSRRLRNRESAKFAAIIVDRELVAQVAHRSLTTSVNYQRLYATPYWRNLFLHDVHVNPEQQSITSPTASALVIARRLR